MTYADGFILSMIGLSVLFAWLRGFSREVITLIAIGIGAAAVHFFGESVSGILGDGAIQTMLSLVILFGIALIVSWVGLEIVCASFLGKSPSKADKIAGAIFGLLRGWLIVGLAYLAMTYYSPEDNMPPAIENAWLKGVATSGAAFLEALGLEKENMGDESSESPTSEQ